jgi:hypothetical protein
MSHDQDFDFKIGRGHYRGRGSRGLIALAIVHLPRAALFGAGAAVVDQFAPERKDTYVLL